MIAALSTHNDCKAQFYYRDIISNAQANKEISSYKKAGVRTIKIRSFEANGEESGDFFCEKRIGKDYKKSTLYTRTGNTGKSLMESYYNEKGQIIRSYDSSEMAITATSFFYDSENKLFRTVSNSRSSDDDYVNELREEHIYQYDPAGIILSMWRVKNGNDSLLVLFSTDENNNIAIEKETKNGSKYYYYYDEAGRLTDLVHANEFKQKMIADYIFEYDETGNIAKMTTSEDANGNFSVWRYDYENGLKKSERIFDTKGMLMGKITYEYK
mgnify:CR=1 FL=1